MSYIIATVAQIQAVDNLHIVKFDTGCDTLSMMSLDLQKNLTQGSRVKLVVKPSHVAIGKGELGSLSYSNQLTTTIQTIENGKLLTTLQLKYLDTTIESLITQNSSKRMGLKVGDTVIALIKASELSICKVIDV